MMSRTYVVPGDPIPLARCRYGGRGQIYDAQKHLKNQWQIVLSHQHENQPLFTGSLSIDVTFYFPMPLSHRKRWATLQHTPHLNTPDLDNCIKFISDVGNTILYPDDRIISQIVARKLYDYEPRTELTITKL